MELTSSYPTQKDGKQSTNNQQNTRSTMFQQKSISNKLAPENDQNSHRIGSFTHARGMGNALIGHGSFATNTNASTNAQQLRVNPELVLKEGILSKKGYLLRFNRPYMVYFERKNDSNGLGPFLKYGRKGKPLSHCVDMGHRAVEQTEGTNGVLVVRIPDSRRKFKIVTQDTTLIFKAETFEERERWVQIIINETSQDHQQFEMMFSSKAEEISNPLLVDKSHAKFDDHLKASPSISEVTDLLLKYEERIRLNRETSQLSYEKFSSELFTMETEIDKKHRE